MEIMPIDRQDSILPMSYLEQGFDINIVKTGERKPIKIREADEGFYVRWGRKWSLVKNSADAIKQVHQWLGYEHLSFYVVYDESPD